MVFPVNSIFFEFIVTYSVFKRECVKFIGRLQEYSNNFVTLCSMGKVVRCNVTLFQEE